MSNKQNDLDDVLEELHRILDNLTSEGNIDKKKKTSVEDVKQEKSADLGNDVLISEQKNIDVQETVQIKTVQFKDNIDEIKSEPEKDVQPENNLQSATQDQIVPESVSNFIQENEQVKVIEEPLKQEDQIVSEQGKIPVVSREDVVKEELLTKRPEQQVINVEKPKQQDNIVSENILKCIFIYPQSLSEAENIFFEQLNSTLKRVSKKPISIQPIFNVAYTNQSNDLNSNYLKILDKVKENNVISTFLITNNANEIADFIEKLSSYVSIIKVLNLSEIRMKSVYLDISIDILLAVK